MGRRPSRPSWSRIIQGAVLLAPLLATLVAVIIGVVRRDDPALSWAVGITLALGVLWPLALVPMFRRISARRRSFGALVDRAPDGVAMIVARSRWRASEWVSEHKAGVEGLVCTRRRVALYRRAAGDWVQVPTAGDVVRIERGDVLIGRAVFPSVTLTFDDGSVLEVVPDHLDRFSNPPQESEDALVTSMRAVFSAR